MGNKRAYLVEALKKPIPPKRRLDYAIMNKNMLPEVVDGSVKPVYYFSLQKQDDTADHLPVLAESYTRER